MTEGKNRDFVPRPLPTSRHARILTIVEKSGVARISDLADELDVNPVTIRRDLRILEEKGLVRKIHGGVASVGGLAEVAGDRDLPSSSELFPVGILVPSLDTYWPEVIRGAEAAATANGMRTILRESAYHAQDERVEVQLLISSGAQALLLAPTMEGVGGERMREWLNNSPVPYVLMEREATIGPLERRAESVVSDHAGGARTAVNFLMGLGHRVIGIAYNSRSPHGMAILSGWWAASQDHNLVGLGAPEIPVLSKEDPDYGSSLEAVLDSVSRSGATALLVHSDAEAVRLAQLAVERGLAIPDDLSIVACDDQIASLCSPALTAIRPPLRTIGRSAIEVLAARLAEPDRPVVEIVVSPTLEIRDSVGPVATR